MASTRPSATAITWLHVICLLRCADRGTGAGSQTAWVTRGCSGGGVEPGLAGMTCGKP